MLILDVITTESRQRLEENALDRLLQGVAGGDRDALAELYGRARTAVYALALSYLKNPTEAEDVTQDTFVQIWEKAPAYRSEGKALAWIMTIARNLALMRLRRQQRAGDLTEEEWMALPDEGRGLSHEERMLLHSAVAALSNRAADRSSLCRHRLEAPGNRRAAADAFAHGLVQISPLR